jgi:toxin ParE1/3/4
MKFSIDERASLDVASIVEHYADIGRGLAVNFIEEVYAQIMLLCANPQMGLAMGDGYRQVLLKRYPYMIVYEVDKATDKIYVVAVGHQSRQPDYWRNRVQEAPAIYAVAA